MCAGQTRGGVGGSTVAGSLRNDSGIQSILCWERPRKPSPASDAHTGGSGAGTVPLRVD